MEKVKKSYYRSISATHHMSLNIEGCLRNHKNNRRLTYIVDDDGKNLTDRQAKIKLTSLLAKGIKLIDCSGECYRFNDQKGCPGHITSMKPNEEMAAKIEKEWEQYQKQKNGKNE